ncbi:MAG: hypothetical protein KatS3mg002_0860 [Candidatus Woesearchaeota archaeon]|nr:MAG: hypothetical protein KatS3mg002_0860 [Candidatus Woesearchaeota archaeon]
MKKKGSMELSVNSIVILVIAVVMLGLILGFIRSKFSEISGNMLIDESTAPEATSSEPITLSRNILTVTGTKKTGLNINFYNTGTIDIQKARPIFKCNNNNLRITGEYYTKTAKASAVTSFTGNIKLNNAVAKDTYLCKVCFLGSYMDESNDCIGNVAEKEFQIVVN